MCDSRSSCERKCGLAADTGREPVLLTRWRAVRCPFLGLPFPPSPSHDGTRHTGSAQQSTHRQMPVRLLRYSTCCPFMAAALDGPSEPHHFAHEIARACIHAHAAGPFASRTTVPLFLSTECDKVDRVFAWPTAAGCVSMHDSRMAATQGPEARPILHGGAAARRWRGEQRGAARRRLHGGDRGLVAAPTSGCLRDWLRWLRLLHG